MSWIFGLLRLDGKNASAAHLRAMARAFEGQEPVGRWAWIDGPIALGFRAQFVTEADRHETRPEASSSGRVAVGDVILDDRDAVSRELGLTRARDLDDTQLLARALDRYGLDYMPRCLGEFALALWDPRSRSLVCARDALGVRPLYYAHLPGRLFAFASAVDALLRLSEIPRRLDEVRVADFLTASFQAEDRTYFEDIKALPAAHLLEVRDGHVRRQRYWRFELGRPLRLADPREYGERLRHHLDRAVACRLRSTGRVGAHLSGGLDSSAITVLAARALSARGEKLVTASFVPALEEGWRFLDERPFVEAVLRQEELEHFFLPSVSERDEAISSATFTGADRPLPLIACDQDARCALEMARRGVRIVLSGWGGDELASANGKGYYAQLLVQARWLELVREGRARCRNASMTWHRFLLAYVLAPLVPEGWRATVSRWVLGAKGDPRELSAILPSFERRLAAQRRRSSPLMIKPNLRRNLLRFISSGHISYRTEVWALFEAQYGVRFRFPLLDRRLLEFCLSVPPDQYVDAGWHRALFRKATAGVLPDEIRWRPDKISPMPDLSRVFLRSKQAHERRIAELERNPRAAEVLDFAKMKRQLAALPTEEELRRQSHEDFASRRHLAIPASASVERGLALADYLEAVGLW